VGQIYQVIPIHGRMVTHNNDKGEVEHAKPLISWVLAMLQRYFPREADTNGYCIPKMHGMTKFIPYIMKYGSGKNFYGGTGESAHKVFVKSPGQKTQRRISEFAGQTAQQWYNMLITDRANRKIEQLSNGDNVGCENGHRKDSQDNEDDITVKLSGKYHITFTRERIDTWDDEDNVLVSVNWKNDPTKMKSNTQKYCLHKDLVKYIRKRLKHELTRSEHHEYKIEGYTIASTTSQDGERVIYYGHPCFKGRIWYDWTYVHFEEFDINTHENTENYYPSKILGFLQFENEVEAVIQCSEKPLIWSELEQRMFLHTKIGTDINVSYVSVPISALVHPLCVLPDHGGHKTQFIVVLPKRNWSRYFGDRIEDEYRRNM